MRHIIQRSAVLLLALAIVAMPLDVGEMSGANAASLSTDEVRYPAVVDLLKTDHHQQVSSDTTKALQLAMEEHQPRPQNGSGDPCCVSAFSVCTGVLPEPIDLPNPIFSAGQVFSVVKIIQGPLAAPSPPLLSLSQLRPQCAYKHVSNSHALLRVGFD